MSTVAQHIHRVRRLLYGTYRPTFNELTTAIDTTQESLSFTYPVQGAGFGSYIEIDYEVMYVWSLQGKTAVVLRGQLGTTPAAHAAEALVEINPRFPNAVILDESEAEIGSWPRSVYRVVTHDYNLGGGDTALDLAGLNGFYDVLRVYRSPLAASHDRWKDAPAQVKRGLPTSAFPSGNALFLDQTPSVSEGCTIRVVASSRFDTATFAPSTDLSACGLTEPLEDALKFGTGWRLIAGREVKRTFTEAQGEPRHAEEVPPMFSQQLAEQWHKNRNTRLTEEAARLSGDYGWRVAR